jgi:tRNA pseudouridine38-40 synthase
LTPANAGAATAAAPCPVVQRLALGVEYDGSGFAGWQAQPGLRTVSGELARAVAVVADHPVALVCGGRTDAGVHAEGQVVHFDACASRPLRAWLLGINSNLPPDVSLGWVRPVPPWFHARFSALSRAYRYRVLNRATRSALLARRATLVRRPLDVAAMQVAGASLLGEHDFSAFRAAGCQSRSPVRRLDAIRVLRDGDEVWIDVVANAFLHHMVRNIAGLLIEVGSGLASPRRAAELLAARDRRIAPPTAAADGLYLRAVRYPAAFGLPGSGGVEAPARSAMIAAH